MGLERLGFGVPGTIFKGVKMLGVLERVSLLGPNRNEADSANRGLVAEPEPDPRAESRAETKLFRKQILGEL